MRRILYFLSPILLLSSCTNVSEDDLIESTPLPTFVTYEANVKTIIDNNCIGCHANPPVNGAPISLVTYIDVRNAVENSSLIERISTQDLGFVMPFGGPRLPQNLIDIVVQWELDGLLEQ